MCVTSVVIKSAQQQWGPIQYWPPPVALDMAEILKRLDAIDKKLGAKECSDPEKLALIEALEKRVAAIELDLGLVAEGEPT